VTLEKPGAGIVTGPRFRIVVLFPMLCGVVSLFQFVLLS
jgi:hypothetical protein